MPRRKYGRLRKVVEVPNKKNVVAAEVENFVQFRAFGNKIVSSKSWKGPEKTSKRTGKIDFILQSVLNYFAL